MTAAACGRGKGGPDASGSGGLSGTGGSGNRFGRTYQQNLNRNVDILFLIDDSSSMGLVQNKLLQDFATFANTLQTLEGGMPDVHIGVISSDMGAGDGTVAGCDSTGGKKGILQYTARGACTATKLNAGAKYTSNIGGTANYTGALADVFRCIGALGEAGCGFEHQFAAILRALGADDQPAPAENQGFLRADANLAIVMLTNEDDCSVTPNVPIFDTLSNANIASQLGPPINFRCNEFGHICDGAHPLRLAPNNDVAAMVTYNSCEANDTEGYLLSALDTANRLKALKADPSQLLVASIQGPESPYVVHWKGPGTTDTSCGAASCPWPEITHSCTAGDTSFADPGVRTAKFAAEFGNNGLVLPICGDGFAPSLERIGQAIGKLFTPACISGKIQDDPTKPGLQPDCTVTAHVQQASGSAMDTALPSCAANGGVGPCWTVTRDLARCSGDAAVVVTPGPAGAPTQSATIQCTLCDPNVSDPSTCL